MEKAKSLAFRHVEFELLVSYLSGNIWETKGYIWIHIQDRDLGYMYIFIFIYDIHIQYLYLCGSYILHIINV